MKKDKVDRFCVPYPINAVIGNVNSDGRIRYRRCSSTLNSCRNTRLSCYMSVVYSANQLERV